jgi:hypothetical protein
MSSENVQGMRDRLERFIKAMQSVGDAVDGRTTAEPPSFLLRVLAIVDTALAQLPFREGDRVALVRDLQIPRNDGWYHCRHFLVQGAVGTVREVVHSGGDHFTFYVRFDDESWVDDRGEVHATAEENRHVFGFREGELRRHGI